MSHHRGITGTHRPRQMASSILFMTVNQIPLVAPWLDDWIQDVTALVSQFRPHAVILILVAGRARIRSYCNPMFEDATEPDDLETVMHCTTGTIHRNCGVLQWYMADIARWHVRHHGM